MPKIVDHDEQRREIAQAVVRWIAQHGLDTLSQRNIAAVCGRSKGNVQHYFPDKRSLMFAALRRISGDREERSRAADAAPDDGPLAAIVRRLRASLPIDRARADEWRARLALYVYANRDADMQAYLADHAEAVLGRGAADVAAAQRHGDVRADLDPRLTFRRLSAVVTGIAVASLVHGDGLSADDQYAMVSEVLKSIAA